MDVQLIIAVTDRAWFDHLRATPDLTEVNFWSPGAASFKALRPGELFLFKLHAPHNVIVDGGVFAYANTMPCSLAWEAFGQANGARSLGEMRSRIQKYRKGATFLTVKDRVRMFTAVAAKAALHVDKLWC
jgi:hypothetical protein